MVPEGATGPVLATIGYEAATQGELIARLQAADVGLVIDVRAVAASRRAGFAKTLLSGGLSAAGIDYLHLRDLGTPKPGRDAARAGRTTEMRAIFARHMAEPPAQAALAEAARLVAARRCCLLCLEADAARCHRFVLAGMLQRALRCEVVHL